MIENLKRIREPVAWAVVAIIAAGLVLGIVRLVMLLTLERVPVFAAFQEIGMSLMNVTLVVALIALVCACLFLAPATPRALRLASVGAVVVGVGAVLQLVCMVLGVAASANAFAVLMEIIGGVLDVSFKFLGAGVLWVLHRGVDAGRLETAPPAPPRTEVALAQPATPPVWRSDEATGTAWRSANEAAAGARPGGSAVPSEPVAPSVSPSSRWQPSRPAGDPADPAAPESRWRPVDRRAAEDEGGHARG